MGGAAGENLEPYSVAILVDFSALRAGFSTHIQWPPRDTRQLNIHIQWSAPPVHNRVGFSSQPRCLERSMLQRNL